MHTRTYSHLFVETPCVSLRTTCYTIPPGNYFDLHKVTVITLTKIAISHWEIIILRPLCALLTHLETLYATSYLRTPIDGLASIDRGSLRCFGTTFVEFAVSFVAFWVSFITLLVLSCSKYFELVLQYSKLVFYISSSFHVSFAESIPCSVCNKYSELVL